MKSRYAAHDVWQELLWQKLLWQELPVIAREWQ
jgi:hypothetical protein